MVIANSLLHCGSRGHIHITSGTDVYAPPEFDPGFLSHPADVAPLLWAYKKTREICRRMPALVADGLGAQLPGKDTGEMSDLSEDDAVLEKFARGRVMTTFHPS
jgi:alcohol oxidase